MVQQEKLSQLKEFITKNIAVTLSIESSSGTPRTKRPLQHMFSIKPKDAELKTLYEVVLRHAVTAEKKCPGSGIELLKKFSGFSDHNQVLAPKNRSEVNRVLRGIFSSDALYEMLSSAIDLSSSSTKISIKKSSGSKSFVDVSEGYNFTAKPMLKSKFLELKGVRVACIDGYIESVSEVNRLFSDLMILQVRKMPTQILADACHCLTIRLA